MKKGARFEPEGSWHNDRLTGARVRQVTSSPAISHPTYFLQSAFLPGDREIFFTSRTAPAPRSYSWPVTPKEKSSR